MTTSKLIFGPGYLGWRVALRWLAAGERICVATRSSERADEFRRGGLAAIVADVTRPETLRELPEAETVLFAVGFDRSAGPDIHAVYADGVKNVLAALPKARQFIYISTTGVYGPAEGEWVDEKTPPDPRRAGGRASLAAEATLASHPLGRRSVILRLAGIYGPGRTPNAVPLRAGDSIDAPSAGWLNLIHVDDASQIVVAADQWAATRTSDDGPHIFCVNDGTPVIRADYYAEAARLLSAPAPTFVAPPADSPAAARAAASRRVSNAKMKEYLGVELEYPDYRAGLAAVFAAESTN